MQGLSLIFLVIQIFHIINDHQCDLEGQCIIEAAQVQPGALLDLLNTIHQSVTMYKQLSGSLRHVQIVLKELVQCIQCLFVKVVRYIVSEDLFDEDFAQIHRKLIDQSSDSQCAVRNYFLLCIEDLCLHPVPS